MLFVSSFSSLMSPMRTVTLPERLLDFSLDQEFFLSCSRSFQTMEEFRFQRIPSSTSKNKLSAWCQDLAKCHSPSDTSRLEIQILDSKLASFSRFLDNTDGIEEESKEDSVLSVNLMSEDVVWSSVLLDFEICWSNEKHILLSSIYNDSSQRFMISSS